MKVFVADEAGFCYGVKRALEIVGHSHEEGQAVQIYGQLIHNRAALEALKAKGIDCIESLSEHQKGKTLIIRTHGIPKQEEEMLKKEDILYTDATCPLVKKLHLIISRRPNPKTTRLIIVGDKKHPEIVAAASYAEEAIIVGTEEEAREIPSGAPITLLAQTTLDMEHFRRMAAILLDKAEKLEIHNTICQATRDRQQAIRDLAPRVEAIVVIGGKHSSNTLKLFSIARELNANVFHAETGAELMNPEFIDKIKHFRSVGITAGASTPPEEIENARNFLKNIVKEI